MKERNVTVTLDKAKEWFNSGNATLKEIALQAFGKEELVCNFNDITTFKKACEALGLNYDIISIVAKDVATFSKASSAMFKLNIIRKALNCYCDLHLVKNADGQNLTWYPYLRFGLKDSTYLNTILKRGELKTLGKITSEGVTYYILGGSASFCGNPGLGNFASYDGVGGIIADIGFLGCATEDIAKHFGLHFGMLIIEAMYGDMIDFKII